MGPHRVNDERDGFARIASPSSLSLSADQLGKVSQTDFAWRCVDSALHSAGIHAALPSGSCVR